MIKAFGLVVIVALLVGCASVGSSSQSGQSYASGNLPLGAKNVEALGNDWCTFELETNGKTRKFLYRGRSIGGNSGTETITEISQ